VGPGIPAAVVEEVVGAGDFVGDVDFVVEVLVVFELGVVVGLDERVDLPRTRIVAHRPHHLRLLLPRSLVGLRCWT